MNVWQIAKLSSQIDQETGEPKRPIMSGLELDEYEMEIFWEYAERLNELGVELNNEYLIEALNANPKNLESGIQAFLQYEARHRFKTYYHPTNYLAKAIREGWKPKS
jgi:hypothetical protein